MLTATFLALAAAVVILNLCLAAAVRQSAMMLQPEMPSTTTPLDSPRLQHTRMLADVGGVTFHSHLLVLHP